MLAPPLASFAVQAPPHQNPQLHLSLVVITQFVRTRIYRGAHQRCIQNHAQVREGTSRAHSAPQQKVPKSTAAERELLRLSRSHRTAVF